MSGGVDSSVAAAMLVESGHEVVGATMKTFCYSGDAAVSKRSCCGLEGIADARQVADRLGIPHYVFDVEEGFTRDVIDDFVSEYANGRTPNPCVQCNSNTKFGDLFVRGRVLDCEGVASGHFARIDNTGSAPRLLRGADRAKDQSYFLWGLPAEMLGKMHFPVGELAKDEVRSRARALGLVTADKPESQEICFVPTGNYRDLLADRLLPTHPALSPGPIVDPGGRVLGRHGGYAGFTVGQRRGIGGGARRALPRDRDQTRDAGGGDWAAPPTRGRRCGRRRPQLAGTAPGSGPPARSADPLPCASAPLHRRGDRRRRGRALLQGGAMAVAPGQSSVFFEGERVLGGGRIRETVGRR